jgi:O-antigen/teichoic acid export membrane protein
LLFLVFVFGESEVWLDLLQLSAWLSLSLPLVGYALIGGFSQAFDGWLVNWTFQGDESQFATWRYGARELPFSLALVAGLSSGLLPGISTRLEETLAETRRRSLRLQHFLFPLATILMLTSRWWFPWVFSEAFVESVPVFNLFLLIIISRLVMSRTIMTGLKENGFVLGVSIVELGLNVGLSFLFVSRMGLLGIALGTVLAYTFEKIAHAARLYRKYGIRPGQYIDLGWLAFYSSILLGAFGVSIAV